MRITSLRLPCSCLCENFLNKVASQLLTWEYPHWGCLAAPYLKISSLRLPCDCFLENFLIEAALGLIAWKFPHEGYLFIETSFLRILYWGYMIEEACLRLIQESSLFYRGSLRWGEHCSFSINFHRQKHFSKVEMIKGKYEKQRVVKMCRNWQFKTLCQCWI